MDKQFYDGLLNNAFRPSLGKAMWSHVRSIAKAGERGRVLYYPSVDGVSTCAAICAYLEADGKETKFLPITHEFFDYILDYAKEGIPKTVLAVNFCPNEAEAGKLRGCGIRKLVSWSTSARGRRKSLAGFKVENVNPLDYMERKAIDEECYKDDGTDAFMDGDLFIEDPDSLASPPISYFCCRALIDNFWKGKAMEASSAKQNEEAARTAAADFACLNYPYMWMDLGSAGVGLLKCEDESDALQRAVRIDMDADIGSIAASKTVADAVELYSNHRIFNSMGVISTLHRENSYSSQKVRHFVGMVESAQLKMWRSDAGTLAMRPVSVRDKLMGEVAVFPIPDSFDIMDTIVEPLYESSGEGIRMHLFASPVDARTGGKKVAFAMRISNDVFLEMERHVRWGLKEKVKDYVYQSLEERRLPKAREMRGSCRMADCNETLAALLTNYFECMEARCEERNPCASEDIRKALRKKMVPKLGPRDFEDWFGKRTNCESLDSF